MKSVVLLGATGSIGKSTLEVIREHKDKFYLKGISVKGKNPETLRNIIDEFKPEFVGVVENINLSGNFKIIKGKDCNERLVEEVEADIYVIAISGIEGILPTFYAVKKGKRVAIANKESIVSAGRIILQEASKNNTEIIPIDSEHSAIFQCLQGQNRSNLRRIILTASGGPFLDTPLEELEKVTVEDVLKHPIWNMGRKITVDSATMMNKGLEMIEAYFLFKLRPEEIDVIIHREGVVHSLVEFKDGAILAQLGIPDMRIPIAYALSYPERLNLKSTTLDFSSITRLSFNSPDYNRFPLLKLTREILQKEEDYLFIALNTANDIAVNAFLEGRIRFLDIYKVVNKTLILSKPTNISTLEDTLSYTKLVKSYTKKVIEDLLAKTN
ncbi:MAG: 1-deoxy-D-xylulose-5-phosphate reductoisomerase [Thermosulfidibacteraceae bacterium]|jgi:1-deoxy-D-xylulose-5-phosphate reductoisomerase